MMLLQCPLSGSTGKLLVTPPSEYHRPSTPVGVNSSGVEAEARIAGIRGPEVKISGSAQSQRPVGAGRAIGFASGHLRNAAILMAFWPNVDFFTPLMLDFYEGRNGGSGSPFAAQSSRTGSDGDSCTKFLLTPVKGAIVGGSWTTVCACASKGSVERSRSSMVHWSMSLCCQCRLC